MYYNQNLPCMNCPMQAANPQMMNLSQHQPNMVNMEANNMETMYPKVYFVLIPHVKHHCDMMENKFGASHCPSKEQLDEMIEEIYKKVEHELENCDEEFHPKHGHDNKWSNNEHKHARDDSSIEDNSRRYQYGRRQAVTDLIGVVLLNELLGRRRFGPYGPYPPYPIYPPFYGYGGVY